MIQSRPASFASVARGIPICPAMLYTLKIAAMVLVSICFVCTSTFAYQLTLEWDANVEQDLAGYIVHYGTSSRDYMYDVDVGEETSCTISNLYSGTTYYFAVTAYDLDGNESGHSAEITYPSSNNAAYAGAGDGGGGSCFISAAAEKGKTSIYGLSGYCGLVLTMFAGFLLCLRKCWKRPSKPFVK